MPAHPSRLSVHRPWRRPLGMAWVFLIALAPRGIRADRPLVVTLEGQVLSILRDDFAATPEIRPGDPVRYRFLVDLDRPGLLFIDGEVIRFENSEHGQGGQNGQGAQDRGDHFFDSLVAGAHFPLPATRLTEEMHGMRRSQGLMATTALTYLAGDDESIYSIEATFTDSPALEPELWVGRSGTLLEALDDFDHGPGSRLFASIQVTAVSRTDTALAILPRNRRPRDLGASNPFLPGRDRLLHRPAWLIGRTLSFSR